MKVSSFKSNSQKLTHVLLPAGQTPESLNNEQVNKLAPFELFRELDLEPDQARVGLDSAEALNAIQEKGFYIAQAQIFFNEGSSPR